MLTYEAIKTNVINLYTAAASKGETGNRWSLLMWSDEGLTISEHIDDFSIPEGAVRLFMLNSFDELEGEDFESMVDDEVSQIMETLDN